MKEKGTLLVVGSLLAFSLSYCDPRPRAAGTLNSPVKLLTSHCQIANNGGDVNIDFGNVGMSGAEIT